MWSWVLADLLADVAAEEGVDALIAYIAGQLVVWGASSTAAFAIAGSAVYGVIGAVIGACIGLILSLIQLAFPTTVQITNGNRYKVSDYLQTNLQTACNWLANPNNGAVIAGATPLWFADQFDLFLANPDWMYAASTNQAGAASPLGFTQPTPPTDSGGPLDSIYGQVPGASSYSTERNSLLRLRWSPVLLASFHFGGHLLEEL